MANINNGQLFDKEHKITRTSTLNMIYKAGILHSSLGDSQRIFKKLVKHLFD
jgi:hypothetical protein